MQIFTKADYQLLRETMRECNRLPAELDKAEACGVDCAGLRGVCEDLRQQLEAIERHYMTPPPKD